MAMREYRRVVFGMTLWSVVHLLPALHIGIGHYLDVMSISCIVSPLLLLAMAHYRSSASLFLQGFPLSLVPLIIVRPELMGPKVYGLAEFFVLIGSTAMYLRAAFETAADVRAPVKHRGVIATLREYRSHWTPITRAAIVLLLCGVIPLMTLHFSPTLRFRISRSQPLHVALATICISLTIFAAWVLAMRSLAHSIERPVELPLPHSGRHASELGNQQQYNRIKAQLTWAIATGIVFGVLLLRVYSSGGAQ